MAKNADRVWNTLKTTYKVSDFVNWYKQGALDLSPNFQRRSVWKPGAKSLFIDTIIKGYPVPMLFLRDMKPNLKDLTASREVVDGQQRIRTVISYIAPKALGKTFEPARDAFTILEEHNEQYQGMTYGELPEEVQERIWDYQFSVNVFPSDTDDREVKQVFARMNSSGYKLNAQELRNAEYFGAFKTLAYKLATEQLHRWRDWKIFSLDGLARMGEVEMTSELIILMLKGITGKSIDDINEVYAKYDPKFPPRFEVSKRFRCVMDSIDELFSDEMQSLFKKRTMFYALFSAVYSLQFGLGSEVKQKPAKTIKAASANAIRSAAQRVVDEAAPKLVLDATTRRVSHAPERKRLSAYLLKFA